MHSALRVTRRPAADVLPELSGLDQQYDALIVNYKQGGDVECRKSLFKQLGSADILKILFIGTAEAAKVPGDDVLDRFDLIFKREHFRDLHRYPISDRNKSKLRTTMLECPPQTISRLEHYHRGRLVRTTPTYRHDVFFSGATTSAVRTDAWETVVNSGLSFAGGLQLRKFRTDRERKHQAKRSGIDVI